MVAVVARQVSAAAQSRAACALSGQSRRGFPAAAYGGATLQRAVLLHGKVNCQKLLRPHCDCGCDGGGGPLNQPFIVATWDNGEAVRPRVFPTRAEAFRVELPNTDVCLSRWRESLPRHLTVGCESHCEFCAGWRGSVKRFSVEKCCLDVVRGHRFGSVGDASLDKR
jgi:hypothetical protein